MIKIYEESSRINRLDTLADDGISPKEFGDGKYKFRFKYYDTDNEDLCLGTEYGWFDTEGEARTYGNKKARNHKNTWCSIAAVYCEPRNN